MADVLGDISNRFPMHTPLPDGTTSAQGKVKKKRDISAADGISKIELIIYPALAIN